MAEEDNAAQAKKPGWKSTEWWSTVGVTVFGLLLMGGFVGIPENSFWNTLFGGAMVTFTNGLYALGRAAVKSALANASGQGGAIVGELLRKKISGGDAK